MQEIARERNARAEQPRLVGPRFFINIVEQEKRFRLRKTEPVERAREYQKLDVLAANRHAADEIDKVAIRPVPAALFHDALKPRAAYAMNVHEPRPDPVVLAEVLDPRLVDVHGQDAYAPPARLVEIHLARIKPVVVADHRRQKLRGVIRLQKGAFKRQLRVACAVRFAKAKTGKAAHPLPEP